MLQPKAADITMDLTNSNVPVESYILIVDDTPTNLKILALTLAQAGFETAVASNGEMALQQVIQHTPELILLDVLMPGMDGFDVCEQLKQNPATREVPVIFMTALSDPVDKVKGLKLGAVDYITKPFDVNEVVARIQLQLQLRSLNKTLEEKNKQLSAALQQLQAAQSQMITQEKLAVAGTLTAGVSHELRNPLNYINNYAEGSIELIDELIDELRPPLDQITPERFNTLQELMAELRENAVATRQHGQRAEAVIKQMLTQVHSSRTVFEPTELNALLDQAVRLAYKSRCANADGFNAVIETSYDETVGQPWIIRADLSRAFINLVDNACYALREKQLHSTAEFRPTLWVKTQKLAEQVEIRIRDNGIGMSPAVQAQIFTHFFTTKPVGEGTGLGLALTHDIIVNQHQGTLEVISEAGSFSEFIIMIPLQQPVTTEA
jgi:signal transduction histidine kinase